MEKQKNLKKKFLTFEEQMNHLTSVRKLKVIHKQKLLKYLKEYNYQNFINGYNDPFMMGFRRKNNIYDPLATEESIIELFNFDRWLNKFILSKIQNIERKFNTAFCYCLADKLNKLAFKNGEILEYLDKVREKEGNSLFSHKSEKKRKEINKRLNEIINKSSNKELIKKFSNNNSMIPIWTIGLFMSFGDLIFFFGKLSENLQKEILKINFDNKFPNIDWFRKIMGILKDLRNRCCHNNVVYNFKASKNRISVTDFMSTLNIFNSDIKIFDIIKIIDYISPSKYSSETSFVKKIEENIGNSKNISDKSKEEIFRIIGYKK